MLLDQVEREPIAAWRSGGEHVRVELDRLAWVDDVVERRANAVPEDRVPERVEPVVGEMDTLPLAGAPRRGSGVLEPEPCTRRDTGTHLVELVGEPADCERSCRHEMLPDAVHFQG